MTLIVFAHRNKKDDKFLSEMNVGTGIDSINDGFHTTFDIMRDVCYKYSKKASEVFFSYPVEAYLFVKYALSDEGISFIRSKHAVEGSEIV